jgi:hypothetical protein
MSVPILGLLWGRHTPQVREAIDAHHGAKSKGIRGIHESADPEEDADIRDDDLLVLINPKDGRVGIEMIREAGVGTLPSSVPNEVQGPAEKLHNGMRIVKDKGENQTYELTSTPESSTKWRVSKSFPHFVHNFCRDVESELVIPRVVQRRETKFGARLWDENLVQIHVGGASVVLGMTDAP